MNLSIDQLLAFAESRPVRDHVNRIVVLEEYGGEVAYFSSSLVISEQQWEKVKERAVVEERDIGFGLNLSALPVVMVERGHPEFDRYTSCSRSGLFAKVTYSGEVEQ